MNITHSDTSQKDATIAAVDRLADELRTKIVGDPVRVEEYKVAQQEAQAYKDAGYSGTVPRSVQSWADAKGWTTQQAADDILTASADWYNALYSIRDLRLKTKEQLKAATAWADIQSIFSSYKTQLAIIAQGV